MGLVGNFQICGICGLITGLHLCRLRKFKAYVLHQKRQHCINAPVCNSVRACFTLVSDNFFSLTPVGRIRRLTYEILPLLHRLGETGASSPPKMKKANYIFHTRKYYSSSISPHSILDLQIPFKTKEFV